MKFISHPVRKLLVRMFATSQHEQGKVGVKLNGLMISFHVDNPSGSPVYEGYPYHPLYGKILLGPS